MRYFVAALCALSALLTSALVAPSAHASGASLDRAELQVVRAVNRVRQSHGLGTVRADDSLSRAADAHSANMLARDFFAHGSFAQRVRRFAPYKALGENLAMTYRCTPRLVVRLWMRSAPHRAVLLSHRYRRIGVGRRAGSLGARRACMWTADFASRR